MKGPCVTAPSDDTPGEPRASVRMDARLDTVTRAKVDDLAARFHRPRGGVVYLQHVPSHVAGEITPCFLNSHEKIMGRMN
jgi:hypothetical protein